MRALKKIVGVVLVLVGLLFTVMALVDLLTGGSPEHERGVLAGMAAFFGAMTFLGARLVRSGASKPGEEDLPLEVIALRTAQANGGTLGAAQLAASAGVSLADAREVLESCVQQGACTVVIDERGLEWFRFGELALQPGEAAKARDLLES